MKGVTYGEEQQHEHERDESVRDKRRGRDVWKTDRSKCS